MLRGVTAPAGVSVDYRALQQFFKWADDVGAAAQVPALAGSGGCLVLVTSGNTLAALVATDGSLRP